jgi:hypothetical protein
MVPYLECATVEGFHEVLRLAAENGPVKIEAFWPADNLTVGKRFGFV